MKLLRTPEDRFAGLPDFPSVPRYASVPDGEGGELVGSGIRAVVPDLVGFGRSDKPTEPSDHSYARPSGGSGRWRSTSWTCAT